MTTQCSSTLSEHTFVYGKTVGGTSNAGGITSPLFPAARIKYSNILMHSFQNFSLQCPTYIWAGQLQNFGKFLALIFCKKVQNFLVKISIYGFVGGPVGSVHFFSSDDPSSNAAEAISFSVKMLFEKRPGLAHFM